MKNNKALAVLLNLIKEDGYHLYTGVLGGRVIFHVLAENGEIDTAVRMLENPTRPSYMQWIDYGETALCEGFGEGNWIDSRNHHFWGNISAFFMEQICGIKVSADTVKIEPFFPTNMNEASASFDSIYGRISASWKRENGRITYSLEYPQKAKEHIVISVNGADIKIKEV